MKKYEYRLVNFTDLKGKDPDDVIEYLKYNGATLKKSDAIGLVSFINHIELSNMDGYAVSYKIDRIDKEFDVIKIGNNTLINIEIKLSNRADRLTQVRDNYQILKRLNPGYDVHIYSYVKNESKLFKYNSLFDELIENDYSELNNKLSSISVPELPNMNFNIKNIYRCPDFFLENNYSLTRSQRTIKNEILKRKKHIFAVSGSGGTGKSLLALDVYKTIQTDKTAFLVTFAKEKMINQKLIDKYSIEMQKYFIPREKHYDVIVIDEAQRMNNNDLNKFLKKCDYLILFYCMEQDVDGVGQLKLFLDEHKTDLKTMTITQTVRNDSSIDRYARKICKLEKSKLEDKNFDSSKIEICMYNEFMKNKEMFESYKLIQPTKSKEYVAPCTEYCNDKNCNLLAQLIENNIVHFEFGQDCDCVVVYICEGYCIKNGKIDKKLPICYGNLQNQLYTIISRTVNKIIFVCDNIEMFNFLSKCRDDLEK